MIPKEKQYIIMCIIYITAYMFCMQFAVMISQTEHPIYKKIDSMNKSCVVDSGSNKFLQSLIQGRGNNYYISDVDNDTLSTLGNCFTSFYNASHFFMYLILGLLCPSLFWETFLLGTGFEIYEYIALDCADPMDIVYNVLGFVIGQSLSEYVT